MHASTPTQLLLPRVGLLIPSSRPSSRLRRRWWGCLHSTPAIAIASDRGGAPVWVPPFYTVEILFSPVATLFNTITILFYIGCHPCTPVYPPPLASEMVMRADWAAGPACACMSVPRQARGRTAPDSCATVGSASCHQPTDKRDSSVTRSSAPRG
jgi:hypothetical protein